MSSCNSPLLVDVGETRILWTLHRPEVHNAVDESLIEHLEEALGDLDESGDRRPVVLTGAGERTFCAGGDLAWFSSLDPEGAGQMSRRIGGFLDRLHKGPRVIIAAVRGDAWGGGCELLTACHLRVAASTSRFAFRQARLGVTTGWGGGHRLFRAIGRGRALSLLLTAREIDAGLARDLGLIQEVVEPAEVLVEAEAWAEGISKLAPAAVAGFLELAMHPDAGLATRESALFQELWGGDAFQETLFRWRSRRSSRDRN